ncbi:MAG: hypothetical protein RLY31_389 [Bacteroidota bacterium]
MTGVDTLYDAIIIGGGAAGFFTAVTVAEARPGLNVLVLERGQEVLQKVRISGGGRCNVTHACHDAAELVRSYPRGGKALRGPFEVFGPAETMAWFARRGVRLKAEADGRMFPVTDRSATIVDCLIQSAERAGVRVLTGTNVQDIGYPAANREECFRVTAGQRFFRSRLLMVATGSNSRIWSLLASLGHTIIPPVPSLFTFQLRDPRLEGLSGLSVADATLSAVESPLRSEGPLLITHWGLSGPAVLRLSAWGARELHACGYDFNLIVNWLGKERESVAYDRLVAVRQEHARRTLAGYSPYTDTLPKRLWERLYLAAGMRGEDKWADQSNAALRRLAAELTAGAYKVTGKSTFKEEFVTAGGVELREVDFRRFESKRCTGLYFGGEVLDIDAVTGGFNFQAAWTGGHLAGMAMAERLGGL